MSRVYFRSPSGTAELHGSERAWLGTIAAGPARSAWRLGDADLEQMASIIGMIPEVPDGQYGANYLHTTLREAQAEESRPSGPRTYEPFRQLRSALDMRLGSRHAEGVFEVAGHRVNIADVILNTALVAGSPPIQLAAKLDGWCEIHAWVNGPDRAWLADVITEGLDVGIFRRGFWFADAPNAPKDRWSDQGWDGVLELLRARADEPVVTSYSASERFPNAGAAGWEPPPMPDDWRPDWAATDGFNEWQAMSTDAQRDYYRDEAGDDWYGRPEDEQWAQALAGLKASRPWLQLTPESLAGTTFRQRVTVYDLLAPNRDERVEAAFEVEEA